MALFKKRHQISRNRVVKKASQLQDLKSLKLNSIVRHRISDESLPCLVKQARDCFYDNIGNTLNYQKCPNALIIALDYAGYIRHDLSERTFLVGKFYKRLYKMNGLDAPGIFTSYDELTDNELYESCQYVSDDWFYLLMSFIDDNLDDMESLMIKMRYGLQDGKEYGFGVVGASYDVSSQKARQIIHGALLKLWDSGLPPLEYQNI